MQGSATDTSIRNMSELRNKNGVTQEKCEKCDGWYDRRGIRLHKMHCDGVNDTPQESTEDAESEPEADPAQSAETEKKRICTDCGSTQVATCADFYDELKAHAVENGGELDVDGMAELGEYELICRECHELFNTGVL